MPNNSGYDHLNSREGQESRGLNEGRIADIARSMWETIAKSPAQQREASSGRVGSEAAVLDFSVSDVFNTATDKQAAPLESAFEACERAREQPWRDAARERGRLERLAESHYTDPEELAQMRKDIARFETRGREAGLSPSEIAGTYQQVSRLMEETSEDVLYSFQREAIARQIMHHAADPTTVDQGSYNTCNVATIESRTYARNPSAAAKLVADVAITGHYRTTSGLDIEPHSFDLQPLDGAFSEPTEGSVRSYASQLFQVVAVNIHYEKHNASLPPTQQIRYEHTHPDDNIRDDSGERLMKDYRGTDPVPMLKSDGTPVRSPQLDGSEIAEISNEITGEQAGDVYLIHESIDVDDPYMVSAVESWQELDEKLKWLKEMGRFPVIVQVDTGMEPLWTDVGDAAQGGVRISTEGAHVVTVIDYHPGDPPRLEVDNSWGEDDDHLGDRSITIHDLFRMMPPVDNPAVGAQMSQQLTDADENGQTDRLMEFELLRWENNFSTRSDKDLDREFAGKIINTMMQWQHEDRLGLGNPEEREGITDKIQEIINILPAHRQAAVQQAVDAFFRVPPGSLAAQWIF